MSQPMVRRLKSCAKEFLTSLPGDMVDWAQKAEESLKVFISPSLLFEALGFRYVGPIQRPPHRRACSRRSTTCARCCARGDGPILVHAITAKGYGYEPAEADPFKYHGVDAVRGRVGQVRKPSKPGPPSYTASCSRTR